MPQGTTVLRLSSFVGSQRGFRCLRLPPAPSILMDTYEGWTGGTPLKEWHYD